jgi:antitoxin Phd
MNTWQLQEAKSRFSELVELVLKQGPQMVTKRGQDAVVIVSAQTYRQINGQTNDLVDTLLSAPRGKALEFDRSREKIRDVQL